jgi:Flp pilus assembly protein TadG
MRFNHVLRRIKMAAARGFAAGRSLDHDLESGQALVETAVAVVLLSTVLIGAAELARVAYAAIEVSNAARAGAQYGAQNGEDAGDTTKDGTAGGIQNAAATDAGNLTNLTTTSSYTCACSDGSASTCQPTDCANSHIEQTLTVNTQATIDPIIHLPGLPRTYTLKGRAIEKCVQ